ncbi:transporter substrate-binding domain-containing protein [Ignatzschineria indica]|uniref:transporter substrate-binding domain-containing protein n=1 Tax=Ignatzschineria indica TaxID=472583 RepID=UPI0025784358|nr:transporter substrate-binding domain-containing protein [Ignatzschineria indica]MDM1545900.1 transporter substrate-binding domain-containing protein [Ignatzschineria indica]
MLKKLIIGSSLLFATQVMAQDVIKIGIEGSYPPFSYISENQTIEGFEPDLAKLFCEKMEQKCEIVQVDFDALIPSLNTKRIDAILASMSITDTRKKAINFSNKYYQTPARFVIPVGKSIDITDEGLKGKKIGVQSGTIHEIYMNDKYRRSADVRSYRNLDEAMMDLETGRIDLVFADVVPLDIGYLKEDYAGKIEFIGPAFFDEEWLGEGVGVGLRKSDTALLDRFNKAIQASREDGSYQEVEAKYFDYDVYGKEPEKE